MCKIDIIFAQYLKICAMELISSFNKTIENSIVSHWDYDALTDYKGATLQFKDVARKIEKLHIIFEQIGVEKGDKIALCGRNSAHWGVSFLACLTYGAVAVPILHEFNAEQIHNIVNHSGSRLLFVGDVVAKTIDETQMPHIEGIIYLPDFSIFMSRSAELTYAREHLNQLFGKKYPMAFRKEHVNYYKDQEEELAIINYTSGTTGFSKGVMLPYRALMGNINFILEELAFKHLKPHSNMLSILPMAHMYGMAVEFLFSFSYGMHLFFLTRLPSPAIIAQAFAEVKPSLVVAVPLIIEKIIRKKVFPKIQNNAVRLLLNMPVINKKVKQKICEQVYEAFGGNAYEIIIGGAAINQEVEAFLKSIDFPYTVGYGTTECAPLISYRDYHSYAPGSCGKPVKGMEVRIDYDGSSKEGEIITRGQNVMLGYYLNEEATREVIDKDGWYHTGDLGTMDAQGNIFIRGRKKNMLLGPNGQNVYPEEIEDKLNSMAMVNESIVIQKGEKFIALVHPDYDEAQNMGFTTEDLENIMEQNRTNLNAVLPAYSRLASITIHKEEFAKTPKKSIKRYLYQNV